MYAYIYIYAYIDIDVDICLNTLQLNHQSAPPLKYVFSL